MADKKYAGVQFQQVLEERDHRDRMANEIIQIGSVIDRDYADFMIEDIMKGNTHHITKFKRTGDRSGFKVNVWDGTRVNNSIHKLIDIDMMPIVPIKDDYAPQGYQNLPIDDPKRIGAERTLRALNVNFDDLVTGILEPDDIPAIYADDGTISYKFRPYHNTWKDDEELQKDYPTIELYRKHLIEELDKQKEDIKHISDVQVGMFATAYSLTEANVVALYYTWEKLFPQITRNERPLVKDPNLPSEQTYFYEAECGSYITWNGFAGWSHIIRNGKVWNKWDVDRDGNVLYKGQNRKSNYHIWFGDEARKLMTDGDPIAQIKHANTQLEEKWGPLPEDPIDPDTGMPSMNQTICLEIQVKISDTQYGEIRIWNPEISHWITGKDGSGKAVKGTLQGMTKNTNTDPEDVGNPSEPPELDPITGLPVEKEDEVDEDYKDVVVFLLSYRATKEVPIFERERLLRETITVGIYSFKKIKTKWYQSGIFQIVLLIVSIILTAYFGPLGLSMQGLVTAAVEMAIAMVIAKVILAVIDNPLLAAILTVVLTIYAGGGGALSMGDKISLAIEATNTYITKYYAQEMKELQKKIDDFKKEAREVEESLDELKEQVGIIREDANDFITWLATLPPIKAIEDFIEGALNTDTASSSIDHLVDMDSLLPSVNS